MKTVALIMCCSVSALYLSASAAMSEDRLIGKLSVTATGNCPATLALGEQQVPVNFLMPDTTSAAHAPVQNRFRYNYKAPLPVAHNVTIKGEIADYAAPGCTLAFTGTGISYN